VVVPVFESADSLRELVERTCRTLAGIPHEIILVNDGSRDSTWDVICALAEEFSCLRGIELARNYGQHAALLCGIKKARHPYTVTMDDDLQHPPEEIPKLLAGLAQGWELVYGKEAVRRHAPWRNAGSWLVRWVLKNLLVVENAERMGSFRAFETRLREGFPSQPVGVVCVDAFLRWGTQRVGSVNVRHESRRKGRSAYSIRKLIALCMDFLTTFTTAPLQWIGIFGSLLFLLGLGTWAWIGKYGAHPSFGAVLGAVILTASLELLALGVVGVYLARLHAALGGRPLYVVRAEVGDSESSCRKPLGAKVPPGAWHEARQ
jgi:glycosyltransferase involved in cell wall biosynthesis